MLQERNLKRVVTFWVEVITGFSGERYIKKTMKKEVRNCSYWIGCQMVYEIGTEMVQHVLLLREREL